MTMMRQGPVPGGIGKKVRFYIPSGNDLLCQPALCAHAVLTLSAGVSFVTGWEARGGDVPKIMKQVLNGFCQGTRRGKVKKLIRKDTKHAITWAKSMPIKTDSQEHLLSWGEKLLSAPAPLPRKPKKKWGGRRYPTMERELTVDDYSFLPPKDPSMLQVSYKL